MCKYKLYRDIDSRIFRLQEREYYDVCADIELAYYNSKLNCN